MAARERPWERAGRYFGRGSANFHCWTGGFLLLPPGRVPKRVNSVRDDTVLKSRFWRDSFDHRRCVVPASSFCEPNGDMKPATRHWFAIKGDEPRPLFALPGIWRTYTGRLKKDGENVTHEAFCVPHHEAKRAGLNHQPRVNAVFLTSETDFDMWVKGSLTDAFALTRRYPSDRMRVVQEGLEKKDLVAA